MVLVYVADRKANERIPPANSEIQVQGEELALGHEELHVNLDFTLLRYVSSSQSWRLVGRT